jgi:hypothetical protein
VLPANDQQTLQNHNNPQQSMSGSGEDEPGEQVAPAPRVVLGRAIEANADAENLDGDDWADGLWVPPDEQMAQEWAKSLVFRDGEARLCCTDRHAIDALGVGPALFFRFV